MIKLFKFLIGCAPLFEHYQFRISDSGTGPNRVSGAWILMESIDMELQLSIERDEITLYFRSLYDKRKRNWYQFSLISKLLGREAVVGIMDESNSAFFADNMDEIMKRFRKEFAVTTIKQLDELKAERSKRM